MVADLPTRRVIREEHRDLSRIEAFLRRRGIDYVTYQDWRILDHYEVTAGVRQGRPRIKRTTVPEMMDIIHQGR
jgi:ferredoxin--NADP+ reductase